VANGRLVRAHLLPPEQLPHRRRRANQRILEERRHRTVSALDVRRDGGIVEHRISKEAFGVSPVGVGGRQVEPSFVLLALALALLETLDHVPLAKVSDQLERALLVPGRRRTFFPPLINAGLCN
jgi:hypothetical protein